MGVNDYFSPFGIDRPHATPNYGPGKYKFEVDYYRQAYYSTEKVAHIRKEPEKSGQEVMYYSKCFNSNYMEFVGYETCDKLIYGHEAKVEEIQIQFKKRYPQKNMNVTSTSSTLCFDCSPHKDTSDILSKYLVSHKFQEYSSKNEGVY